MFSKEILHGLFAYKDSGNLIWLIQPNSKVPAGSIAGTPKSQGYLYVGIKGKHYLLHRLIYAWHTGEWPPLVDHKDRNNTNNKIDNLRALSGSMNHLNSSVVRSNTGHRGVYFDKNKKRYISRIGKVRIGSFVTASEAGRAYEIARKELFPDVFL